MSGSITITQVQSLTDPLKAYQFQMIVSPVRGQNFLSGGTGTDIMSLRCTATELPGINLEPVRVDLAGYTVAYPGRIVFNHVWTCTLVEGQDSGVRNTIASWMKLAYNWMTGVGSNKADIQSTGYITLFTNPDTPSATTLIQGLFPIGNPSIQLAMGNSSAITPTIVWSFDYIDIDKLATTGTVTA